MLYDLWSLLCSDVVFFMSSPVSYVQCLPLYFIAYLGVVFRESRRKTHVTVAMRNGERMIGEAARNAVSITLIMLLLNMKTSYVVLLYMYNMILRTCVKHFANPLTWNKLYT